MLVSDSVQAGFAGHSVVAELDDLVLAIEVSGGAAAGEGVDWFGSLVEPVIRSGTTVSPLLYAQVEVVVPGSAPDAVRSCLGVKAVSVVVAIGPIRATCAGKHIVVAVFSGEVIRVRVSQIRSLPDPPSIVSLPVEPWASSFPPSPYIVSAPEPP